mgnify:CR=1 FL=1
MGREGIANHLINRARRLRGTPGRTSSPDPAKRHLSPGASLMDDFYVSQHALGKSDFLRSILSLNRSEIR